MSKTKQILVILILLLINTFAIAQESLTLKNVVQLKGKKAFELSGFCLSDLGVLAVEDEKPHVYKIDTAVWQIVKQQKIKWKHSKRPDFEGIEACGADIFIVDESTSFAYRANKYPEPLPTDYASYNKANSEKLNHTNWRNAGYEGLAMDCENKILYLAKERQAKGENDGRYILVVDLNQNGKIVEKFTIPTDNPNPDFADIKFERRNGTAYLYLLERNLYLVTRLNLNTKEIVSYSFKEYMTDNDLQNLYKANSPEYGIAEALLLTKDEIWIGTDNNQQAINAASSTAQKYSLSGKNPAIFICKRPDGF